MTDPSPVDPEAASRLRPWLAPDEELRWAAVPDADRCARLRPRLVVLGVFWSVVAGAGFYGFGATLLSSEYDGLPLAFRAVFLGLGALPFVLVAVVTLYLHVPLARRAARRRAYGVTDERVVAAGPVWGWFGRTRARSLPVARALWEVSQDDPDESADVEVRDARSVEPPLVLAGLDSHARDTGAAVLRSLGPT